MDTEGVGPIRYEQLAAIIAARQPVCGSTKVVAIDGPSGSGKTRIASGLAEATGGAVLHFDDIYPGWHGLAATAPVVARDLLAPTAIGEIGALHRWDWIEDRPGPQMRVAPPPLLILDGVGSGAAVIRPFLSLLIWVEAPLTTRKRRALARDGGVYEPFWDVWASQESRHFLADPTRGHADLVIDTGS